MRKKHHLPLKILLTVIALLLAFVLFLWINGTCREKSAAPEAELASWMAGIPDETPLKEIAIPGSHDAGTAGMIWAANTQKETVGTQLLCGARYFDIRVHKNGENYPIYHDIIDGTDFREILPRIRDFIVAHPTETLLLDFQHFKGGSADDVRAMLEETLAKDGLVVRNDTEMDDVAFISALTLGQARGKCVIFFGETDEAPCDWIFLRNDDECTRDDRTLDSFYLGELHRKGFKALTEEAHPVYFSLLREKQAAGRDGIFVLQCQLTDGKVIFGPWSLERGQEKEMSAYIRALTDSPDLKGINVIMRDFLTPEKCRDIIDLNKAKGILK